MVIIVEICQQTDVWYLLVVWSVRHQSRGPSGWLVLFCDVSSRAMGPGVTALFVLVRLDVMLLLYQVMYGHTANRHIPGIS